MATYKFEQFKVSITNPTVSITGVKDNMVDSCTVDILLVTDTASFGVTLDGFTYAKDTWENSDIESFVTNKLTEYEI